MQLAMDERERLLKVIETEKMTAKQFADEIGVGAGTISNITGGRNNPSLEVLQKVLNRFRHINAQWLILGTGTMYITSPSGDPDLFTSNPNPGDVVEAISNAMSAPATLSTSPSSTSFSSSSSSTPTTSTSAPKGLASSSPSEVTIVKEVPVAKTIQKIVIFYSDGTFEER